MMNALDYPIVIEPLSANDGGGFAALVPDLPGCMSDGETQQEAVANVQDAIRGWIEAAEEMGRPVPPPSRHLAIA
jgi:antitoxin HicB